MMGKRRGTKKMRRKRSGEGGEAEEMEGKGQIEGWRGRLHFQP